MPSAGAAPGRPTSMQLPNSPSGSIRAHCENLEFCTAQTLRDLRYHLRRPALLNLIDVEHVTEQSTSPSLRARVPDLAKSAFPSALIVWRTHFLKSGISPSGGLGTTVTHCTIPAGVRTGLSTARQCCLWELERPRIFIPTVTSVWSRSIEGANPRSLPSHDVTGDLRNSSGDNERE